jgi:thiamine-monophosphate kinase
MLSEFELIRRYFTHPAPRTVLGVGDDAALVRVAPGRELVVAADLLISGRHFFPDADPRAVGHKALAVNLSDMAAMGATARWATLALALPRAEPAWLKAFAAGFMALARRHAVALIGGDTTRGPLAICVQILGEVPAGQALLRSGARRGDDVWVSGTIGDAALAVAARKGQVELTPRERARLGARLDRPMPRLALGKALLGIANSAIDISDGLCADLGHICEGSALSARIEFERLPVSEIVRKRLDLRPVQSAVVSGGDDYELCFTAPRARRAAVLAAARRAGVRVTQVGSMQPIARRPGVTVLGPDGQALRPARGGYDHFR